LNKRGGINILVEILFIIYLIVAYKAVNVLFYEGKVVIYSSYFHLFIKKLALAFVLGWILIPIAIIKKKF